MGQELLSQDILEHVLQYVDGETLLTCSEVSPEFAAAVSYLGKSTDIWKKCFSKERGDKYPYNVVSKLHPHVEKIIRRKNWGRIYEACLFGARIGRTVKARLKELKLGKYYSDIECVETHGELILVLVKYNKDFSKYQKIVTVSLENKIVDKSCRFCTNMLYLSAVDDPGSLSENVLALHCDFCDLMAVPLCPDGKVRGFPRLTRAGDFLRAEHSNGEVYWINKFQKLLTRGSSFHSGRDVTLEELKLRDSKCMKISHSFTNLSISCGRTHRVFNSFRHIRSNVTASLHYASLLILGTNTGRLYTYKLDNESDLCQLNLEKHSWYFDVCLSPILCITVMELVKEFVIVCTTEKSLYSVYLERKLHNFISF